MILVNNMLNRLFDNFFDNLRGWWRRLRIGLGMVSSMEKAKAQILKE
jgi:hypothetical protein